jgi:hypothetical protein
MNSLFEVELQFRPGGVEPEPPIGQIEFVGKGHGQRAAAGR